MGAAGAAALAAAAAAPAAGGTPAAGGMPGAAAAGPGTGGSPGDRCILISCTAFHSLCPAGTRDQSRNINSKTGSRLSPPIPCSRPAGAEGAARHFSGRGQQPACPLALPLTHAQHQALAGRNVKPHNGPRQPVVHDLHNAARLRRLQAGRQAGRARRARRADGHTVVTAAAVRAALGQVSRPPACWHSSKISAASNCTAPSILPLRRTPTHPAPTTLQHCSTTPGPPTHPPTSGAIFQRPASPLTPPCRQLSYFSLSSATASSARFLSAASAAAAAAAAASAACRASSAFFAFQAASCGAGQPGQGRAGQAC